MHDTDRILAELAALDHAEHEAESQGENFENLENFADFEFVPEANFETGGNGPGYETEFEHHWRHRRRHRFDNQAASQMFNAEDQYEAEDRFETQGPSTFSETDQMELAAELLEVRNEEELDHFLGGLLDSAVGAIGHLLPGGVGKSLTGLLKGAASKLIPVAGSALGGMFGGPVGAALGGNLASAAGKLLGLELEGLAREDQESETAKAFVRFAADAAQDAATAPPDLDPVSVAHAAFANAASRHAPGLLATSEPGPDLGFVHSDFDHQYHDQFGQDRHHHHHHHDHDNGGTGGHHHHHHHMTGRWVRVARNQIMIYGI